MLTAPEIQLVKLARLLRKTMILVMKMFSLRSLRVKNFFSSTNLNCTQDVGKTLIKERIYLEIWDLVKLLYT